MWHRGDDLLNTIVFFIIRPMYETCKKAVYTALACFAVFTFLGVYTTPVLADTQSIVTTKVKGVFHDISENIRMAIIGKGINISHVLPASQMLNRTGTVFGYKSNVYINAETYEFCSARISQKLSRLDPDNIVLCPFTISVYVIKEEPDIVRISYRIPTGRVGTEDLIKEIVALISGIIDDATW